MIYMNKSYDGQHDIDHYLKNYVGQGGVELDRAVTALMELQSDSVISEELAKRLLKILLSKHLHNEIIGDIQADSWLRSNRQKLRFMGLQYGRREEIFAD